jgi:sialate O-acetylesterase
MVAEWRRKWGRNFPFYFTQIAPFDYTTWNVPSEVGEHVGAYLRDEQRRSMDRIENSGMAVILDVGEVEQIHPVRKEKVGERLGLMALAEVYGTKGFEYKSPTFERMEVDGDKAVIFFKDLYYGLTSYGKPLHLFEIADESKVFHPAEAYVDEERDVVIVSSKYVRNPKAVRYAFKNYVEPELFSLSGLPVSSFRTDNW